MGNEESENKERENQEFENKEKFQELCQNFSDYLNDEKYHFKLDEKKNTIIKKIKENAKKNTILSFIRLIDFR